MAQMEMERKHAKGAAVTKIGAMELVVVNGRVTNAGQLLGKVHAHQVTAHRSNG